MAKSKKKKHSPKGGAAKGDSPAQESAPREAHEHKKVSAAGGGKHAPLKRRKGVNWFLFSPAVAGMALTAYMSYNTLTGTELAFCGQGGGCDIVQGSRWGYFMGFPTSLLGFGLYFMLGWVALRVRSPAFHFTFAWLLSLVGVAYSVYLTVISLWVIGAFCPYCVASLSILTLSLIIVAFQRPAGLPDFRWLSWVGQTLTVAVAIVAGMHFYYSGAVDYTKGPEDPYIKGLAIHLKDTGAIFYGAYW